MRSAAIRRCRVQLLEIGDDGACLVEHEIAAALTTNDVDDRSQVGPLLDQIDAPIASFTGDGAYDQDGVYSAAAGW